MTADAERLAEIRERHDHSLSQETVNLFERARQSANDMWNRRAEVITRWDDGSVFGYLEIKKIERIAQKQREDIAYLLSVAAERDALRARIEAALAHAFEHQDSNGGWPHVVALMHAALAGNQPESTPDCATECGPGSCAAETCVVFKSHQRDAGPAGESTPEPPHLDPMAYAVHVGGVLVGRGTAPIREFIGGLGNRVWAEFAPRPADENGNAYSQNQEDYP